ncbi:MAG: hypothetical protein ACREV5_06465, partial [Steroidobacter sp.]
MKPSPTIGFWALVLGLAGFVAGFFGPMLLRPDANQGPMVGIFITGPGGAAAGLVLGVLFRFLPVTNARRRQALFTSSIALALGTLYFCLPPPDTLGMLMHGELKDCQSPAAFSSDAISHWEKRVANAHWMTARAGWKEDVPRMLSENRGVVLTIDVRRQNPVRKHRKPWNTNRIDAEGWTDVSYSRQYFADFAGAACSDYPEELPMMYM